MGPQIALGVARIDEKRSARIDVRGARAPDRVDPDDAIGAGQARPLHPFKTDTPRPNTTTLAPGSTLAVKMTAPIPVVTPQPCSRPVKRGILANLGDCDLGQLGVAWSTSSGPCSGEFGLPAGKTAGAVRHQPLALGRPDGGAQVRLARQAALADAALGRIEPENMITSPQGLHLRPTSTRRPRLRGRRSTEIALGVGARESYLVGVTDISGLELISTSPASGLRVVRFQC